MVFITLLFYKQAFSCHLFWLFHSHHIQIRVGRDVRKLAAFPQRARLAHELTSTKGTGFVVCAVKGSPVS